MPVQAVRFAGRPTVSSGSSIAIPGSILGWNRIFLTRSASSMTAAALPTSEPVPAVVGTATMGRIASASARVQRSARSSKSNIERLWPAMKATVLPTSMALPPPNAMTPSWPPARSASRPRSTSEPVGLGLKSEKTSVGRLAAALASTAAETIGRPARPGSATSRALPIPKLRHASASSATRPAPNRISVG